MSRRGRTSIDCREMVSSQIILVLISGEIWKSLSTETPSDVSISERNVYTSTTSPTKHSSTVYRPPTTGPSLHTFGSTLTAVTTTSNPIGTCKEPSNESQIAAMIIGVILVSMTIAILVIILWKCCRRPLLVNSNWAGRSPFADGDTPDIFMDSGQATKRSSVLSVLPWKFREDTHFQHDLIASEKPPSCTTSHESSQVPPPAEDCSAASISASSAAAPPASDAVSCTPGSCPHPDPGSSDLPPPPDWLREPTEDHSSDPSKQEELHSEIKEQFPPPPELIV
ncbi:protein EVI2B [Oxyura jamaicensis]|uniref:protein EVI2B n=1 Tax=Oxyura jamaicensis TaxID=8884 RepID=UPI0015A58D30|nr:protein EVI2B [Oxyura jamaicensis]